METTSKSRRGFFGLKGLALVMLALGVALIAVGVRRFWIRPEHFGFPAALGCGVGAVGGFFLLLVAEYILLHARLVFIPLIVVLIYFAIIQPHFAVGLGVALGIVAVTDARS
jgi:hypothetical protein